MTLRAFPPATVFAEVPNEVSLAFPVSGCPGTCPGCHSPELRGDGGRVLDIDWIQSELRRHHTCVLFLGGDHNAEYLVYLAACVKLLGRKVGIYSGKTKADLLWLCPGIDYLKLGPYIESRGPLGSINGNQVFWQRDSSGSWEDATHLFSRKHRI